MYERLDYKVDFNPVEGYWDIHGILKESLELPDYYGGSLDALYDCLTDLIGYECHIEIYGLERLKRYDNYGECLIKVFRGAKHAYDDDGFDERFHVTIVHKDGSREEIE